MTLKTQTPATGNEVIVITTHLGGVEFLKNLLTSFDGYNKYPILVVVNNCQQNKLSPFIEIQNQFENLPIALETIETNSYEFGGLYTAYQKTGYEEILLLSDTCQIVDTGLFDLVFEAHKHKSVAFSLQKSDFSINLPEPDLRERKFWLSHLGKYRRKILAQMSLEDYLPENLWDAITKSEVFFTIKYHDLDPETIVLFPDWTDRKVFAEICGKVRMKIANEYIIKWKSHWNIQRVLQDGLGKNEPWAISIAPTILSNFCRKAREFQRSGHLERAEGVYFQILDLQPNYHDALYGLGLIAKQRGELGQAEKLFQQILKFAPDSAKAWESLGNLSFAQEQFPEAIASYQKALEFAPQSVSVNNNLGYAWQQQGNWEEAISCYQKALEFQPDCVEVQVNLANAFHTQGKLAQKKYNYYAQLNLQLGTQQHQQGNLKIASNCYRQAIALKPDLAEALYNLGIILKQEGNLAEANDCCREALKLKPNLGQINSYLGKYDPQHQQIILSSLQDDNNFTVDVIICIHNSLEDVKACLASVEQTRTHNTRLIIVNDGSDDETSEYLNNYLASRTEDKLIVHSQAQGYTRAANAGLKLSTGDYAILLNSDTIVPKRWIEKLIEVGESDLQIGIVSPLSNAAPWQSVPEIFSGKDIAINAIPSPLTVEMMSQMVELQTDRDFPKVPTVNGFCFAIKRVTLEKVGYFDAETFPGYNEENDYCFRATDAGFSSAIATHCYIYHAHAKSYTEERRQRLVERSNEVIKMKYGSQRVQQAIQDNWKNRGLAQMRKAVKTLLQHLPLTDSEKPISPSFLFLLPVLNSSSRIKAIQQEVMELEQIGFEVKIAIPQAEKAGYESEYAQNAAVKGRIMVYETESALYQQVQSFDLIIATDSSCFDLLTTISQRYPLAIYIYYAQNEACLWAEPQNSWLSSPNLIICTQSREVCQAIEKHYGFPVHLLGEDINSHLILWISAWLAKKMPLSEFSDSIQTSPLLVAKMLQAAYQWHRNNDLAQAERGYETILTLQPDHTDALHGLALVANQQGQPERAKKLLRESLQIQPNLAKAWESLGNLYQTKGEFAQAIEAYQKALSIEPKSLAAFNNLGYTWQQQEQWDRAIACYQKALELKPDCVEAQVNLGNCLFLEGKLAQAQYPQYAQSNFKLGRTQQEQGNLTEAITCYRQAITLNAEFPQALYNLGFLLREVGELEEGNGCLQKALKLNPSFGEIHYDLGKFDQQRNQFILDSLRDYGELVVDVIINVHSSLDQVKNCLASVEQTRTPNTNLIVVNAQPDPERREFLQTYFANRPGDQLILSDQAMSPTEVANTGLKTSNGDYVILLDSDTIVPRGWIEKLIEVGESDPQIVIVSPLSNAMSWQSIREFFQAENEQKGNSLPLPLKVEMMAQIAELSSHRSFPQISGVDGFCFALKRKTIDRIGYFHENDVTDYSQENDYCLRAKEAGFSLAIASHSYVHHTKPRSYSVKEDLLNPALEQLKKRIDHFLTTFSFPNSSSQSLLSVLFLLPVPAGGGGTHSVMQEVAQLRQLGIEVKVAISSEHQNSYVTHYAQSFPLDEIGLFYEKESVLYQYAGNFKIVIATYFTSVKLLENIIKLHPHIVPSYYAQDYEPLFFKANTRSWHEARLSYTRVPSTVIFAKTHWIRRQIEEHHGVPVHKVKPSLDRQIFNTHNRKDHSDQIRIVAMVRIRTSWRRPQETVRVLQALKNRYGEALSIRIFGTDAQELELVGICPDGWGVNLGILNRSQVADLFRDSDLFIDLSEYQAFGRTGLEAMACGAAVVLPEKGGIREYARHQQNAILVNTDDEQICLEAIVKLIEDPDTLFKLKREGLSTSLNYSIERAAYSELILFLSAWLSKKTSLSLTKGFERPRLKYEMTQNRIMTDRDPALPFLENKWIFYRRCDFFAVPHIPVIAKAETIEGSIPIIRQLIASKRSFVMKTSHGCGDTLIITADNHGWKVRNILMPEQSIAKPEVLFQLILDHAVKQLHRSHSYQEWAVVTSWPRVLIFEEFVLGAFQADFKVCVAYGKAVFCLCCTDRYGDNGLIGGVFRRNDWNLEGCLLKTLKRFHGDRQAAEIAVKEAFSPIASDAELWTMAEKLVPPHIELQRVDFYQTANGQFLAGEYTSYSNAGLPSYEEKVEAQLASIIRSVPRVTRPFPTAFVRTESSQIPLKTLFYALDRGIPYIVIADNDEEARQAVTEGSDNVIWTALLAQKL